MRYIIETEFIGHENEVDVLDDTPVMGSWRDVIRKHLEYGPYKTRVGVEKVLNSRKKYWKKRGYKCPPRGASLYDPKGNYMFTQKRRESPDHVVFDIEEREVSKRKISS